jgi:hypothetical protein
VKAGDLFVLGVVGIGLYYVYKSVSGVANAASAGVTAATCGLSSGIASLWNSLTLNSCTMSLQGNIVFPNGAQVAASSVPIGTDCQGNVYAQYQGGVYQLSGSNSCGNWPATQVS